MELEIKFLTLFIAISVIAIPLSVGTLYQWKKAVDNENKLEGAN